MTVLCCYIFLVYISLTYFYFAFLCVKNNLLYCYHFELFFSLLYRSYSVIFYSECFRVFCGVPTLFFTFGDVSLTILTVLFLYVMDICWCHFLLLSCVYLFIGCNLHGVPIFSLFCEFNFTIINFFVFYYYSRFCFYTTDTN